MSTESVSICCGGAEADNARATTRPCREVDQFGRRMTQSSAGVARYGERNFWGANYDFQDGIYGVPHTDIREARQSRPGLDEETVKLDWRRHNARFHGGFRNLTGGLKVAEETVNFSDWKHSEIVSGQVDTRF